jgi:hypothetical protein
MFCKLRIDVEPAGRLGSVQVVVQLGLQSAVHVILLTLPLSVTVYVVSGGEISICIGPSEII